MTALQGRPSQVEALDRALTRWLGGLSEHTKEGPMSDDDTVVVATAQDMEEARENALRFAGLTLGELREQAATGHFDTVKARLAWIVVSGLP